ncbi:hypothetical protein FEM48_Zijuj11G0151300 [Ziziphus jujuba var. spinosa]|uniref:Uncharacterized protein n=1 Tax=Ziziphus jujuba var. spinosa TaxID=714518 RepID=A0A978UJN3_ZIZJJ|nr:hypothetical protein FEM48_Zijuj11G0151300 [Ziziphus jujuba var. spinosa]
MPVTMPPPTTALPIISHLHLLTDMPHITFSRLFKKLGPIIYLQLHQVPTVIILSYRLACLALITHDHVFGTPPVVDLSSVPILWLFRCLLFPKRSLLKPSTQNLHHQVAEYETDQLIPTRQGRGGEQDVGLGPESVPVKAQHEQGILQLSERYTMPCGIREEVQE